MANVLHKNIFLDDILCKYCHNEDMMRYDYKEGHIVCTSCGCIALKRFIDFTAEYRLFSEDADESDPRRTAGPAYNENLEDGGLGTLIEIKKGEKIRFDLGFNKNKKYSEAIQNMKTWGHMLGLDMKTIYIAIDNYEILALKRKTVFKNKKELMAALLFMASRTENSFLHISELENVTGVAQNNIKKYFWLIKRHCSHDGKACSNNGKCICGMVNSVSMKPSHFAKIFADKLNLPSLLREKIKCIGEKFEKAGILEGKNPKNIASVIIYNETNCVSDAKKSLKEISEISEISENTIKKSYENLINILGDLEIQITQKDSFEKVLQDLEKLCFN